MVWEIRSIDNYGIKLTNTLSSFKPERTLFVNLWKVPGMPFKLNGILRNLKWSFTLKINWIFIFVNYHISVETDIR